METSVNEGYAAFVGARLVAAGDLPTVLRATKQHLDESEESRVLIFADETGRQVEFDFRGSIDEVLAREAPVATPRPGRPKLGVISREVSLLPRHWEWLELQPSGISAALRRLVEEASKREPEKQRARRARDATGRLMTVLAGNLPGYEEASRALYAGDEEQFRRLIKKWPADVRGYLMRLAEPVFAA